MDYLLNLDIEALTGFRLDLIILALAVLVIVLIIIMIINGVKMSKLKKKYQAFMTGSDGKSLEESLIRRLDQIDELFKSDEAINEKLDVISGQLELCYQKTGIVKYDAFNEMGGKLSFSLALLNRKNNGFIINAMHSREGCYTYTKEIIDGKSVIMLSEEEQEALNIALASKQ